MTAPDPPPKLDRLSGLVERVTYHNGENGFCVLRLKVKEERELVTLIEVVIEFLKKTSLRKKRVASNKIMD